MQMQNVAEPETNAVTEYDVIDYRGLLVRVTCAVRILIIAVSLCLAECSVCKFEQI